MKNEQKNVKQYVMGVLIAIVCFGGGYLAGKNQGGVQSSVSQNGGRQGSGMNRTAFRGSAGLLAGDVVSKDATSLSIKMRDGGSRVVLYSPSTSVLKSVAGVIDDVIQGEIITVSGTPNSDGSITAQSIQIRQNTQFGGMRNQTQ